jgi:hypothetical protein
VGWVGRRWHKQWKNNSKNIKYIICIYENFTMQLPYTINNSCLKIKKKCKPYNRTKKKLWRWRVQWLNWKTLQRMKRVHLVKQKKE